VPEETKSLTIQAYELLRRDIVTRTLAPGADVSESELAERLRMSKTPVREALARLRSEGFVETFPRRGYRITPMTLADMNELFDVRIILEGGTGALAAQEITESELTELDRLADASYSVSENDTIEHFVKANHQFHSAIARAARRQRLFALVTRNLDDLERFFYLGARAQDINPQTKNDHHRIVETLRLRDPEAARRVLKDHNEATRAGLMATIVNGQGLSLMHLG
jgi:DNA-binding GntR family transcriptional regulator